MTPCLNWKEIEFLVSQLRSEVEGLFVDRVIVPERPEFPESYIKGEWSLRLTGRSHSGTFNFSVRPRHPYFTWSRGKGSKAATFATHSPFDLALSKHLKGAKLLQIQNVDRDRSIIVWFSSAEDSHHKLGLILLLIPAAPEAFLVKTKLQPDTKENGPLEILARTRTSKKNSPSPLSANYFEFPDNSKAPPQPEIRESLLKNGETFFSAIELGLQEEGFAQRVQNVQKQIQTQVKHSLDRSKQSQEALKSAQSEEDWQRWADLLKASMGLLPQHPSSSRTVIDYVTQTEVTIPGDPRLSLKEQVEKFYHNARRKQRRIQEAQSRLQAFQEKLGQLEASLKNKPAPLDWEELKKWEIKNGILPPKAGRETPPQKTFRKSTAVWLGKTFLSKDRLQIFVGRNKDENMELTFKVARGNDIWMHVRGRPGAHTVIPLQNGKSVPLETLLDAAVLTIFYSGGENWGKTEVDYTSKKYVKRIKNATEASYTHNKTLLIEPDSSRLKRLLSQLG